ncbi:MAG: hypothetical protein ABH885_03185 [Candidatus Omnitrophota bacterium]
MVACLKSGSAYYSPSAGVIEMIKCVKEDKRSVLAVSAFLEGEYGITGCFLGVPAVIGKDGIIRVEEYALGGDELKQLGESARKTKEVIARSRN